MGHELTINKLTGKAEMFYVGDTPWHSLGNRLAANATSAEAMEAAGMGWLAELKPLYLHVDGKAYELRHHRAVVRSDVRVEEIGVVGMDFHPFQNQELFDFCDTLVGQKVAMYHTAGTLRGGSRVWVLCELPGDLVIVPGDAIKKYLLVTAGHDGSCSLTGQFTGTRVVCSNTLKAALRESGTKWQVKIRHTRSIQQRAEEAAKLLGISQKYFEVLGQKFQAMSAEKLNDKMVQKYFEAVFPLTKNAKGEDSTRVKNIHETLAFLFAEGRGNTLAGVKGTLWGAYNAVTEYVDHVRGVRKNGQVKDSRAESALFGSGAWVKQRAFDAALAVIGKK